MVTWRAGGCAEKFCWKNTIDIEHFCYPVKVKNDLLNPNTSKGLGWPHNQHAQFKTSVPGKYKIEKYNFLNSFSLFLLEILCCLCIKYLSFDNRKSIWIYKFDTWEQDLAVYFCLFCVRCTLAFAVMVLSVYNGLQKTSSGVQGLLCLLGVAILLLLVNLGIHK